MLCLSIQQRSSMTGPLYNTWPLMTKRQPLVTIKMFTMARKDQRLKIAEGWTTCLTHTEKSPSNLRKRTDGDSNLGPKIRDVTPGQMIKKWWRFLTQDANRTNLVKLFSNGWQRKNYRQKLFWADKVNSVHYFLSMFASTLLDSCAVKFLNCNVSRKRLMVTCCCMLCTLLKEELRL